MAGAIPDDLWLGAWIIVKISKSMIIRGNATTSMDQVGRYVYNFSWVKCQA